MLQNTPKKHSLNIYGHAKPSKMKRWTIEEELVVVYYASRYVKHTTIVDILAKKCSPQIRTQKQITSKVLRLRKASGQKNFVDEAGWPQNRGWDRKLADQWLFRKRKKETLEELLKFDGETAAIIDEVSRGLKDPQRGFVS